MPESGDIAVSTRIVTAVAEAEGTDPLSLSPPLGDLLDADGLDRLCDRASNVTVSFVAWGYLITVDEGSVEVIEDTRSARVTAD